jgi:hypothetical protein
MLFVLTLIAKIINLINIMLCKKFSERRAKYFVLQEISIKLCNIHIFSDITILSCVFQTTKEVFEMRFRFWRKNLKSCFFSNRRMTAKNGPRLWSAGRTRDSACQNHLTLQKVDSVTDFSSNLIQDTFKLSRLAENEFRKYQAKEDSIY